MCVPVEEARLLAAQALEILPRNVDMLFAGLINARDEPLRENKIGIARESLPGC
ncbi:MAG: hypothetical protein HY765_01680 [Rhodomicrobium sp.]|nr:hypothetical protein [Rhodomicrobium sp.]